LYLSPFLVFFILYVFKSIIMRKLLILLFLTAYYSSVFAQQAIVVYDNNNLKFYSRYWQDSLKIDVAIPESNKYVAPGQGFPLLLLFDQQNRTGFEYHLHGINLLSGAGAQIPGIIVAGLPFDPEMRLKYTDTEILKDSLSGLESTAMLIFNELIPTIEQEIAPISFLMIAGHSRTGWLVNYLLSEYPEKIHAAGSFSGFYELDSIKHKILNRAQKSGSHKVFYYLTSGDSYEEQTYLKQNIAMAEELTHIKPGNSFRWEMDTFIGANHITNYALSVPQFLTKYFSDYNAIIGEWFEWKQDSLKGKAAVYELQKDFDALPYPLIPQLLHYYSLASHYYNNSDFETALFFIENGLSYYPKEPGFKLFEAELFALQNMSAKANASLEEFESLLDKLALKPSEKEELLQWYELIKKEIK